MARKQAGGRGFTGRLRDRFGLWGDDDIVGTYTAPTETDEDAPKPLGVRPDYRVPSIRNMTGMSARAGEGWAAQGAGHGSIFERGPRYWDGDEWSPGSLDPASIGELQGGLAAAGLLTGRWRFGVYDTATMNAYKDLLSAANAAGLSAEQMMQQYAQGIQIGGSGGDDGEGGGGGGSWQFDENGEPVFVPEQFVPPEALPLKLPSREDMTAVTRAAVIERLGQGWSQGEIDGFIDAYYSHAQGLAQQSYNAEVERQRTAFETGVPTTNVNTQLDIASPEASLEETLRREQPDAFGAGQIANDFAPAFFDALGGYV